MITSDRDVRNELTDKLIEDPIDYCYLSYEHLEQINRLLRDTFWPGIDGDPFSSIIFTHLPQYPSFWNIQISPSSPSIRRWCWDVPS